MLHEWMQTRPFVTRIPSLSWHKYYRANVQSGQALRYPEHQEGDNRGNIGISFDPGETTGLAISISDHQQIKAVQVYQIKTKTLAEGFAPIHMIMSLQQAHNILFQVVEDYRVYGWKGDDHKWAALHTPQLIGMIQAIHQYNQFGFTIKGMADSGVAASLSMVEAAYQATQVVVTDKVPITLRMAQHAKAYITDEKLKEWNLYIPGMVHGRDAVRHLMFQHLFGADKALTNWGQPLDSADFKAPIATEDPDNPDNPDNPPFRFNHWLKSRRARLRDY